MKKIFQIASIALVFAAVNPAMAQNAREGSVKFMKGQQSAVMADYDMPASTVESALKERLEKSGLSNRGSSKGFVTYKATTWNDISPDKVDVYTKVEGKGNKSTVTVLVSQGYDNFISGSNDPDKTEKVKNFLNGFMDHAAAYQLKLAIEKQEEIVKKADKDQKKSVSDGEDLSKEREKLEKKIADNKDDQTKKQTTLDQEKQKLEELKRQLN